MRLHGRWTCLAAGLIASALCASEKYTFELDGKTHHPWISNRGAAEPGPGDVVRVGDFALCLDEPGFYRLLSKDNMLFRIGDDGEQKTLACAIKQVHGGNGTSPQLVNPLARMNRTTLRGLRGVTLATWSPEIEVKLGELDFEKACILIEPGLLRQFEKEMPPVPARVQMLILETGGSWECKDFSRLSALKELTYLDMGRGSPNSFDFAVLKDMPLEFLGLPWTADVKNVDELASLVKLRVLEADGCPYLGDGRVLGGLKELRVLRASHIGIFGDPDAPALELSVLAKLANLRAFHVQDSRVASIPTTFMPHLAEASLLKSDVPEAMMSAFSKANPKATIRRSMNAELSSVLANVDRLAVRTRGEVRRGKVTKAEALLFQSKDPRTLAELVRNLKVSEERDHGSCMCRGNPVFEFYSGDRLVAELTYHHGTSIGWRRGVWPTDGKLTSTSAEFLTLWLAKLGLTHVE